MEDSHKKDAVSSMAAAETAIRGRGDDARALVLPAPTEGPSSSSSSSSSGDAAAKGAASGGPPPPPPGSLRTRRKPIPNKGHSKSRNGCLTCRSRRVKCSERFPECAACARLRLPCEWPEGVRARMHKAQAQADGEDIMTMDIAVAGTETTPSRVPTLPPQQQQQQQQQRQVRRSRRRSTKPQRRTPSSSPTLSTPLRTTPGVLSMGDLRLFHHFLFTAYPPLPLGGEDVWRNISTMAHSYDFLGHAILGAAASHLALCEGHEAPHRAGRDVHALQQQRQQQALGHRVRALRALRALNAALDRPSASDADVDARFATTFLLAFQSSFMPDGMYEFFLMLRGCFLVTGKRGVPPMFSSFEFLSRHEPAPKADVNTRSTPLSEPDSGHHHLKRRLLVDGFLQSIDMLGPLCTDPVETRLYTAMKSMIEQTYNVAAGGARARQSAFHFLMATSSISDFSRLADPANPVGRLLLAHMFLVRPVFHVSAGITTTTTTTSASASTVAPPPTPPGLSRNGLQKIVAAWVRGVTESLDPSYQRYARWPLAAVEMMLTDRWLP